MIINLLMLQIYTIFSSILLPQKCHSS